MRGTQDLAITYSLPEWAWVGSLSGEHSQGPTAGTSSWDTGISAAMEWLCLMLIPGDDDGNDVITFPLHLPVANTHPQNTFKFRLPYISWCIFIWSDRNIGGGENEIMDCGKQEGSMLMKKPSVCSRIIYETCALLTQQQLCSVFSS